MSESPRLSDLFAAWELFRDPMLCALVAGAVLGWLSVYLILRRMVFVSAALTQSAALGVAGSFYAEIHLGLAIEPVYGAALATLLATTVLVFDPERVRMTRESVLGLLFAASGAAAVLVGSRISQGAHDVQAILFGSAVLVRPFDLGAVLVVGAAVMAVQVAARRGLAFASFDPVSARVQGLPVRLLDATLLGSVAAAVSVSARALGALPVFALSTLPAMAALCAGFRLPAAFAVAAAVGAFSGFGGYALAFLFDLPVGAAEAGTAAALALIALSVRRAIPARRHGLVA